VEHDLKQTVALLERTPSALNALLRDLPEGWTSGTEDEGTWTVSDVIAHLADAEITNWLPRIRTILAVGDTEPFPAFNRTGFQETSNGKSLPEILDDFAQLRSKSLGELSRLNLTPEDLKRRGLHPRLGVVTLSEVLAAWAAHDLTHLHQISRILAFQYRDSVGPFRTFIGVMQCHGHGS
jgi:hypothetical protein